MKRRSFLAHTARVPAVGSAGYLAIRVPGSSTSARQTPAAQDPLAEVDSNRTALLVMDFQPAWIATLPESDALLERAAEAIALARAAGVRVAYTWVAFTPADYAAVPEGNVIFTGLTSEPGALDETNPALGIDARVAPETKDKVVRKTRVSAFARTDLDGWLRALWIDTLILTGISTSGVVLSTVCDGADRDYRLIVLGDACADRDAEIQDVLLHRTFPQRAEVSAVAALRDFLGGG